MMVLLSFIWEAVPPVYAQSEAVQKRSYSEWKQLLLETTPEMRKEAFLALKHYRQATELIPYLMDVLKEGSAEDRRSAITLLSYFGADAKVAVPSITCLIIEDGSQYGRIGLQSLARLGRHAQEAIPALITTFAESEQFTLNYRCDLITTLASINISDRRVKGILRLALMDTHPVVRAKAAFWLWTIAKQKQYVNMLVECTTEQNKTYRSEAYRLLVKCSRIDSTILPHCLKGLDDREIVVRHATINALSSIGSPISDQFVYGVIKATTDTDWYVRYVAASTLGEIGKTVPCVLQQLDPLVDDLDPMVQISSIRAICSIDSQQCSHHIRTLLAFLRHKSPFVRADAVKTLGAFDRNTKIISMHVDKLLMDEWAIVRLAATEFFQIRPRSTNK